LVLSNNNWYIIILADHFPEDVQRPPETTPQGWSYAQTEDWPSQKGIPQNKEVAGLVDNVRCQSHVIPVPPSNVGRLTRRSNRWSTWYN
jgi:hypothetical protein